MSYTDEHAYSCYGTSMQQYVVVNGPIYDTAAQYQSAGYECQLGGRSSDESSRQDEAERERERQKEEDRQRRERERARRRQEDERKRAGRGRNR